MPQKSAPELFAVVHYLHRLSTEGKRGAKMALESCPKCHFIMLEGVLMTIEEHGQNGTIYVSDLAAAVKQPLPAVYRALRNAGAPHGKGAGCQPPGRGRNQPLL